MTRALLLACLAGSGMGLGLLLAIPGVPYGRTNITAFAELYHGAEDTTGTVHVAVDCDPGAPGTQASCFSVVPDFSVDITVANSTAADSNVTGFNFYATTNELILDPKPGASILPPHLDNNPDFNNVLSTGAWSCYPVAPSPDANPDPAIAESFISCAGFEDEYPLPADAQRLKLASVHYTTVSQGVATIDLATVNVFNHLGVEIVGCEGASPSGPCFSAQVNVLALNDADLDGVPGPGDNCPTTHNPDQMNSDQNFTSNAPLYVVDDATRANSDNLGNVCDTDDDNDGLSDGGEFAGCNGSGPTSLNVADTDGDRILDGAECARGTNPASAASKPTAAQCGATTDVDGDRLMERIELCNYNTSSTVADTDGDGWKDGCEAVSLNGDLVVNSADQLLFSQEHIRVLGGGVGLPNLDLNKDGNYNSIDQLLMAFLIIPTGQCP